MIYFQEGIFTSVMFDFHKVVGKRSQAHFTTPTHPRGTKAWPAQSYKSCVGSLTPHRGDSHYAASSLLKNNSYFQFWGGKNHPKCGKNCLSDANIKIHVKYWHTKDIFILEFLFYLFFQSIILIRFLGSTDICTEFLLVKNIFSPWQVKITWLGRFLSLESFSL